MAHALIALGSNEGDRTARLRQAIEAFAALPQTQLVARSAWHETAPIGGTEGQGAFLNGDALLATSLSPRQLLERLQGIEAEGGRDRTERWAARTLDLDILLFDDIVSDDPELTLPHPRMVYRPFVLEPAADIAPWMVHAESGWTVRGLLEQLRMRRPSIAVSGDPGIVERTIQGINSLLDAADFQGVIASEVRPALAPWNEDSERPTLLLTAAASAGTPKRQLRKMLGLPATGPVAWFEPEAPSPELNEALAAVKAVWPSLANVSC